MLGQPNFCRFEVRYFLALLGHNKATLIGLGTVIDPNSNIDYTVSRLTAIVMMKSHLFSDKYDGYRTKIIKN